MHNTNMPSCRGKKWNFATMRKQMINRPDIADIRNTFSQFPDDSFSILSNKPSHSSFPSVLFFSKTF